MKKLAVLLLLACLPVVSQAYNQTDLDKALITGSCPGCDLNAAEFSGVSCHNGDFSGAQLIFADFRNAKCLGANFSDAKLNGAQFWFAELSNANFSRANLSRSVFFYAKLINAKFEGNCFLQKHIPGIVFIA